nr:MAG TPA: hypothetical protein [Caudoviricetes sp.]
MRIHGTSRGSVYGVSAHQLLRESTCLSPSKKACHPLEWLCGVAYSSAKDCFRDNLETHCQ